MEHDRHTARLGRQVPRPPEPDASDFRQGQEHPTASVRMLDLEARRTGELRRLLPVTSALIVGQASPMLPSGLFVLYETGLARLVEAMEVPVGRIGMAYRLLERNRGHLRQPTVVGIPLQQREHMAQLVVGLWLPTSFEHELALVDRPVIHEPAVSVLCVPEESTSDLGGGKGKMNLIESMAPMPLSAIGKILIDVSFATEKITSIDEKAADCHNLDIHVSFK